MMRGQDEFTDSTDWLPTPLAALAPLDSSLRCQVCKDFFTTPMMTSCSHTFCSLCIRRYLSQEGRCPTCRESDQEIKLRPNLAVDELVTTFMASRKPLLKFAIDAADRTREELSEAQRPRKRRKVEETNVNGVERRSTRSQSKKQASEASQQSAQSTQDVVEDSEEGSVYEDPDARSLHFVNGHPEPNDGLVECPCCRRRMKEALINSHLDKCIAGDSFTPIDDAASPAPRNTQIAPPGTIAYAQRKPSTLQNDRLPFINYSLLNDISLRKKLRDLGIPNHGQRELMRRRHTEWVNLWNANCDSINPVSKRQLLQELKVWEDTLGRQGDKSSNSGFMAKDFDRERHVKIQKNNFDELIKQARKRPVAAVDEAAATTEDVGQQSAPDLEPTLATPGNAPEHPIVLPLSPRIPPEVTASASDLSKTFVEPLTPGLPNQMTNGYTPRPFDHATEQSAFQDARGATDARLPPSSQTRDPS